MSKKLSHPIIEVKVSQIPYFVGFKYSKVRGTSKKLTRMLIPLKTKETIIFFFALRDLASPFFKKNNKYCLMFTNFIFN